METAKNIRCYLIGGTYDGDIIHTEGVRSIVEMYRPTNEIKATMMGNITTDEIVLGTEMYELLGEAYGVVGMSRECQVYVYKGIR